MSFSLDKQNLKRLVEVELFQSTTIQMCQKVSSNVPLSQDPSSHYRRQVNPTRVSISVTIPVTPIIRSEKQRKMVCDIAFARTSGNRLWTFKALRQYSSSPKKGKIQNHLRFEASSSLTPAIFTTRTPRLRLQASPSDDNAQSGKPADEIWDKLGFDPVQTDYMYIMKCSEKGEFSNGGLQHFGSIELNPSACVLNYAQGIIEGLKAYKKQDDSILLFRPAEFGSRMRIGADRMCMPAPTIEQFIEAVKATILANRRWIPPPDKGFLHIRSLLMGSGPVLSLTPASEFTFLIYVTPVGNYYKSGMKPVNLLVQTETHHAVPGGAGSVGAIGNYAGILKAQVEAKANCFSDVLYLDPIRKKYIEETSTANIFVVKDKIISTPLLGGTILPGVTRKSIIEIAGSQGFEVEERLVSIDELFEADEVFCTGNAVCLQPVGSITYNDIRVCYKEKGFGSVSQQLYLSLSNLQMGLVEDVMGWTLSF